MNSIQRRFSGCLWLLVSLTLPATAATARGHAILIDSSPKDKQTVHSAPKQIVLTFGSKIEKKVFTAALTEGSDRKIALPPAPQSDEHPEQIVLPMPALEPGTYRLEYQVLASDGHTTPGVIHFTIAKE